MNNTEIKDLLKAEHIYMWQVAKVLNIHETTFIRWFWDELSEERKRVVLSAIEEIKLDRLKAQE